MLENFSKFLKVQSDHRHGWRTLAGTTNHPTIAPGSAPLVNRISLHHHGATLISSAGARALLIKTPTEARVDATITKPVQRRGRRWVRSEAIMQQEWVRVDWRLQLGFS
jgi:hypothetical protein